MQISSVVLVDDQPFVPSNGTTNQIRQKRVVSFYDARFDPRETMFGRIHRREKGVHVQIVQTADGNAVGFVEGVLADRVFGTTHSTLRRA